jgi:hypothetical protein
MEHVKQRRRLQVVRFSDLPEPEPIDTTEALPAKELTWTRILTEEPAILDVFAELQRVPGDSDYERWHAFVARHGTTPKAALSQMVGWGARNPRLRSLRDRSQGQHQQQKPEPCNSWDKANHYKYSMRGMGMRRDEQEVRKNDVRSLARL